MLSGLNVIIIVFLCMETISAAKSKPQIVRLQATTYRHTYHVSKSLS